MINLIKAEIYRLSKGKVIKIFLIVTIAYIILRTLDVKGRLFSVLNLPVETATTGAVGYSELFLLEYSGIFAFFVPFLIVRIFGIDFGRGCVANLFGHGIKRSTIYISKYIVFSATVLALQLIANVANVGLSSLLNGWGSQFESKQILDLFVLTLNCAFMHISTGTATILLALILRSEALVVVLFFALSILESVVAAVLRIVGNSNTFVMNIAKLFETNYSVELFKLPVDVNSLPFFIISVCLNIVLSIGIGVLICKRKELK